MGESSADLCDSVVKHLTYVLKWYKVTADECALCLKSFIRAHKDTVSEEVTILPVPSSAVWSFEEFASLRECLPIAASAPLTLAIVDPSGVVVLYSVCDGISEDLHYRTWRPSRNFLENPEKCIEAGSRKTERNRNRSRLDRGELKPETSTMIGRPVVAQNTPDDVIVIDD